MRISDWSSDVCSSDLRGLEIDEVADLRVFKLRRRRHRNGDRRVLQRLRPFAGGDDDVVAIIAVVDRRAGVGRCGGILSKGICGGGGGAQHGGAQQYVARSEEHTSELQSLMRISYAVFCLKKTNTQQQTSHC